MHEDTHVNINTKFSARGENHYHKMEYNSRHSSKLMVASQKITNYTFALFSNSHSRQREKQIH